MGGADSGAGSPPRRGRLRDRLLVVPYLRQPDADAPKVDRCFIHDLAEGDSSSSVTVRSVLSIGRQMGLDVIAGGVESARDPGADVPPEGSGP